MNAGYAARIPESKPATEPKCRWLNEPVSVRQSLRPLGCVRPCREKILADFDQDMGIATGLSVDWNRVISEIVNRIWLVFANEEFPAVGQHIAQDQGKARIPTVAEAEGPGSPLAIEFGCEAMNAQQQIGPSSTPIDHFADCSMIGVEQCLSAACPIIRR